MNPTAWVDWIGLVAGLAGLVFLRLSWKKTSPTTFRHALAGLVFLMFFNSLSNALQWSGISSDFDPFEDYIQLLVPLLWALLVYSLLQDRTQQDLKATAEQLRQERDLVESIAQTSPAGIMLLTPEGKITYTNQRAEQVLGKPQGDLLGNKCNPFEWGIVAADGSLLPQERLPYIQVAQTRQPLYDVRCSILRGDGQRVQLAVNAAPLLAPGGELQGVVLTFEDITRRLQAEQALRESEERLRGIIEQSNDMIILTDETGAVIEWNPSASATTGLLREQALGRPIWEVRMELAPPEDQTQAGLDFARQAIQEVLASGQAPWLGSLSESTIQRGDGARRLLQSIEFVIPTGQGYRLASVMRDMTDYLQTKAALHKSERNYRQIFNASGDAIFILDPQSGEILDANQTALDLFGYSYGEILRLSMAHLTADLSAQTQEDVRRLMQQTLASGPQRVEWMAKSRSGENFWIEVALSVVELNGQPRVQSAVRDISRRKRVEADLRIKDNALASTMAAVVMADLDGNLTYVNQAFLDLWGLSSESQALGSPVSRFWADPEEIAQVLAHINQKGQWSGELTALQSDGRRAEMLVTAHIVYDVDRRPLCLYGSFIDISEKKRAEKALRLSEQELAEAQRIAGLGRWVMDLTNNRLSWSDSIFELFEIDRQAFDASYETFLQVVHPDDRQYVDQTFKNSIEQRLPYNIVHRLLMADGRVKWVNEICHFDYDPSGKPLRAVGTVQDTTGLHQAQQALQDSQRRLSMALRATRLGAWEWNLDTRQAYWSDENYLLLGYAPGSVEASYDNWMERIHPEDRARVQAAVDEAVRQGGEVKIEFRVLWPDGSLHWIDDTGSVLFDAAGKPSGMYGIQRDITERKQMEQALFDEKERAQVTLHSIGDAVITTDAQGLVEYLNPTAETLTGWTMAEARGRAITEVFRLIDEHSRQPAADPVAMCLQTENIVGLTSHVMLVSRSGKEYDIDDTAAPIRAANGQLHGAVLVFHDVTEARRLERQIAHNAAHDTLTGLVNRREFEVRVERAMLSAKERGSSHVLCYMDLDQFKIINDTAGHAAGDEVLKQVANLLSGLFRQRDTLARLGGDEFGLLLENCPLERGVTIAGEVISQVSRMPFEWQGRIYQIGVSIGITPIDDQTESLAQALSEADVACYTAKDLGRGRLHVYQWQEGESALRHGEILRAARLRDALEWEQFQLYAQPILPLQKMEDQPFYELLLRLLDEGGQLLLPATFIPSAERYGMMSLIDRWVIQAAFQHYTRCFGKTAGPRVTINLSGNSLSDETLLDFVYAQFHQHPVPPKNVCFEITETAAIHNLTRAVHFASEVHRWGGCIALDDFGSGLSSFRYLKNLPVDYLKIEGGFVRDIHKNDSDRVMVAAINQVGHTLGIRTIAEHVSDTSLLEVLRQMGVDYAQGFGVGKPLPLARVWGEQK